MWRLWHRLFGWHYVHVRGGLTIEMIRRVMVTAGGERYVRWWGHSLIWIDRDRTWKVTPLTFAAEASPQRGVVAGSV